MLVFNSEMHLLTFMVCLLEFGMFCYQLVYFLSSPKDESRFWYLVLLGLLIVYNITGGLLPDEDFALPVMVQNIIAYGSGFLMAAYFPYYFYRAFNLQSLRFHALYGVLLFLLIPYFIFFGLVYPLTDNIELATSYGMIIPFIYSFVVLYKMLNAIRIKVAERQNSQYPYSALEMIGVYAAVSPWVTMSIFAYLQIAQWIEVLVTNLGFLIITLLFITKSIKQARITEEKLKFLERAVPSKDVFEANLLNYNFTFREMEIIRLIRAGLSYQEIADKLFIAPTTVSRHVQNIHYKADVKNRLGLIRKLEMP